MTLLGILASSGNAIGSPTAFPTDPTQLYRIKNQTSSSVLADHADPKIFWVMPPNSGSVQPGPLTGANANLGFCAEMADLQSASAAIVKRMTSVAAEYADKEKEAEDKRAIYNEANKAAEEVKASNSDLQQVVSLEDEVASLNQRVNDDLEKLNKCGEMNSASCQAVQADLSASRKQTQTDRTAMNALRPKISAAIQAYNRKKAIANAAKEDLNTVTDDVDNLFSKLSQLRVTMQNMYKDLAKLEGGFTTITYDLGWAANRVQLTNANPGYAFLPVVTHNVVLNTGFVGGTGKDSYLSSVPSILDYSVNGVAYAPFGNPPQQTLGALSDRMSATLHLSLVGACPVIHPELYDIPKSATGTPLFGMSAHYEFPSVFKMNVTFRYDLSKFYQLMKSSGSSGGLFSSSSWSSTSENNISNDAFSAHWHESDPDEKMSESERRGIEREVKQELTNRVLKEMATPVLDGTPGLASAPPIPEHGAIVLANGLSATCGWYSYYCTGGSWILRGLDSIFGSSSTEQNFTSRYSGTATEKWSRETTRWKPAAVVFAGQAK